MRANTVYVPSRSADHASRPIPREGSPVVTHGLRLDVCACCCSPGCNRGTLLGHGISRAARIVTGGGPCSSTRSVGW
jgi:hypothetical protein